MKQVQLTKSRSIWKTGSVSLSLVSAFMYMSLSLCASPIQAQECEPHWSDEFPTGDIKKVRCAATFDDGSGTGPAIFIGGNFDSSGLLTLNKVAKLMPDNTWAPLGEGTDGQVYALTTFDDGLGNGEALYAAGYFNKAGDGIANGIAKWDGNEWSPLGAGTNEATTVLAVFDDGSGEGPMLYAAGNFTEAGGVKALNIARWNGLNWSELSEGIVGLVKAMTVYDDGLGDGASLYIGGSFDIAGGMNNVNIARWDGNSWSNLGEGIDGSISGLSVFDDGTGAALYAGGYFDSAGTIEASNIAKWDGLDWSPVGEGMDSFILSMASFDDGLGNGPSLYATGNFNHAGGNYAKHFAKWDGEQWSEAASGLGSFYHNLATFNNPNGRDALLVLRITSQFSLSSFNKWDGEHWSTAGLGVMGSPTDEAVLAFNVVDSDSDFEPGLYVSGQFTSVETTYSPKVARWHEGEWSSVGGGIPSDWGWVYDLVFFDEGQGDGPVLFAGGIWANDGNEPEIHAISKFNGEEWLPMKVEVDNTVRSMIVFDDGLGGGDRLYVAGSILHAGDKPVDHIATWDGVEWAPLAGGGTNGNINVLFAFDDGSGEGSALYAGGKFTMAGNIEANNIAKWDGVQWLPMGPDESSSLEQGMDDVVRALGAYDDGTGLALYAGGSFNTAGGLPAVGIAKWQDNKWSPLAGGGIDSYAYVRAFQVFDDNLSDRPALYISGNFISAGNIPAKSIARWDGKDWMSLGLGLHIGESDYDYLTRGFTMIPFDDGMGDGEALFVGGDFTFAGEHSSQRIAKWVICANATPGDLDGDGSVGTSDLLILLSIWGPCADCNKCQADLDGNCIVGTSDLLILLSNWG